MRRAVLPYLLLLVLLAAVLWGAPPAAAERSRPLRGAPPLPGIEGIEGLATGAAGGLPAWRAARARPGQGAPVGIGGRPDRLELEGLRVDLGGGLELTAARGVFDGGSLHLTRDLAVEEEGRVLLRAAALTFSDGRARTDGVVVFRPGTDREHVVRGLDLDIPTLHQRLRR